MAKFKTETITEGLNKKELTLVAKQLSAELQVRGKAKVILIIWKVLFMFKKAENSMHWPTDMYYLFLQSVLTGTPKDVYGDLSTSQFLTMNWSQMLTARYSDTW